MTEKIMELSAALLMTSVSLVVLNLIPNVKESRKLTKAKIFETMANGHRNISLAKTYDAKAAALAMKTVMKELE